MVQEEKNIPVEQQRLEKEQIEDMGSIYRTRGAHAIHCLTVIGQVEGHVEAPQGQKTTKYEHVIPQLVAVQEDPAIEGLLVLLNTVGGDVEAGLALAELIASISKPSAAVVLGGGHSFHGIYRIGLLCTSCIYLEGAVIIRMYILHVLHNVRAHLLKSFVLVDHYRTDINNTEYCF